MKRKLLGIAIGGTKSAVSLGEEENGSLTILNKKMVTSFPLDKDKTFAELFNAIDEWKGKFEAIGIIAGGPLDQNQGVIISPPHLKGLHGVRITEIFTNRYHVPSFLLNDADAGALAEARYGAGVNKKYIVFCTFGTGFGAGIVLEGKLYNGIRGQGGEVGHVRLAPTGNVAYGKAGSVESFVAGAGIGLVAKNMGLPSSVKEVTTLARSGNQKAIELMNMTGSKLGEVVGMLLDILNPDAVILGGIYPRCMDLLKDSMLKKAKMEALPINFDSVEILPSKLAESIDEYASLTCAVYGLDNYGK